MKKATLVGGLAALALLASGLMPALSAEIGSVKADPGLQNLGQLGSDIKSSFKKWWEKEKKRAAEQGIDKRTESDRWCGPDAELVGWDDGGPICRSKHPFSVSCRVLEYQYITDDSGTYAVPSKTECDPPQGFGGSGTPVDQNQAP